jgi:DNA repair exonuclease SbcCD ATPase subunit
VLIFNGISAGALSFGGVVVCMLWPRKKMEEVVDQAEMAAIRVDSAEKTLQGQILGMRSVVQELQDQLREHKEIDETTVGRFFELCDRLTEQTTALQSVQENIDAAVELLPVWQKATDLLSEHVGHLSADHYTEGVEELVRGMKALTISTQQTASMSKEAQMLVKMRASWETMVTKFSLALTTIASDVTAQKTLNASLQRTITEMGPVADKVTLLQERVTQLTTALEEATTALSRREAT